MFTHSYVAGERLQEEYVTEYSTDKIEMHVGAIKPGQRVLLVRPHPATHAAEGLSTLRFCSMPDNSLCIRP
jgi:hypothetical protein